MSYTPKPYTGRVVLFTGSEATKASSESGWRDLITNGLKVYQVPGDHLGMLREPNVRVLGEQLQACLDACEISSVLPITTVTQASKDLHNRSNTTLTTPAPTDQWT
ncbi:MAG: hypothetical protein F6K28_52375 [Microcoleus sp. SIO2G3]|nr:hypothetical protein [Microcoleus sp. SIO2G3]